MLPLASPTGEDDHHDVSLLASREQIQEHLDRYATSGIPHFTFVIVKETLELEFEKRVAEYIPKARRAATELPVAFGASF